MSDLGISLKVSPASQTFLMKELVKRVEEAVSPAKLSRASKAGAKFMAQKIKDAYKSNNYKVTNTTLELRKASTNRSALYDTGELMRAVQERKGLQTKNTSSWYVGFKDGNHSGGVFKGARSLPFAKLAAYQEGGFYNKKMGKYVKARPIWQDTIDRNVNKMRDVIEKELGN